MRTRISTIVLLTLLCGACATIPLERYGVHEVDFEGVEEMDSLAIAACMITRERPRVSMYLGMTAEPTCGSPPFDSGSIRLGFWRWGWTEWPLYDEVVLERDFERIIRWYAARGYYDAEVVDWSIEPPDAMSSDLVDADTDCEREGSDEGCTVSILITIDEGLPVIVTQINVAGIDGLDLEIQELMRSSIVLTVDERFDEAAYEETKVRLARVLGQTGYARATLSGRVQIDRDARTAVVHLEVSPGPLCHFGEVTVTGNGDLPADPIREATLIWPGDSFSTHAIRDAQAAVYDLGAFATVNVAPQLPDSGDVVPVLVEVTPARRTRFSVGGGIQSGIVEYGTTEVLDAVPQWDLHLLGTWEHRNFLGGLRRLRLEERPRLVFVSAFPVIEDIGVGNVLGTNFAQPAFIEPRTTLALSSSWDVGPDPYLGFFRHEIEAAGRLSRHFFDRKLFATIGVNEEFLLIPDSSTSIVEGATVPNSSDLFYFEQQLTLDLRDDVFRPRLGLHTSLSVHEAGYFMPSSWSYVRIVPDVRTYLPLPLNMVLVGRFTVGALLLDDASEDLDHLSQEIGPITERLHGGGGTFNRGFFPGALGDGPEGGIRRWLASLELRIPVTRDFFITLFSDAGDVSREAEFRFDHPQMSAGLGFRLLTLIGPIRLDFGWRIPDLQVLADVDERSPGGERTRMDLWLFTFPGAINLTIGDPL